MCRHPILSCFLGDRSPGKGIPYQECKRPWVRKEVRAWAGFRKGWEAPPPVLDNARAAVAAEGLRYTGAGVTIAVLDTGAAPVADLTRPLPRIVAFRDFVNRRPAPYDDNGHGTQPSCKLPARGRPLFSFPPSVFAGTPAPLAPPQTPPGSPAPDGYPPPPPKPPAGGAPGFCPCTSG